jgi:hypothetical protein
MYAFVSFIMVVLSIFVLCAESHPSFKVEMTHTDFARYYGIGLPELYEDWYGTNDTTFEYTDPGRQTSGRRNNSHFQDAGENDLMVPQLIFVLIDLVLMVYFTMELVIRFIFCPKKIRFFAKGLNIVDIMAVLPFYIEYIVQGFCVKEIYSHGIVDALFVLKIFRIFRILRVLRHYRGLQVLVLTIKHSWKEMLLLAVFLFISILIFGSLIYFANKNEDFSSIPKCFWWAIVTMTTVGYGDLYPTTDLGYVVGAFCALTGVLVIGFTVPTLVNNFLLFYNHIAYKKTLEISRAMTEHAHGVILVRTDDNSENEMLQEPP